MPHLKYDGVRLTLVVPNCSRYSQARSGSLASWAQAPSYCLNCH
ncbi:hypothetical protein NHF46_24590 [Arthrobacter alpinus]|nr:hypothetical protein [Arthrobacter alpinus]